MPKPVARMSGRPKLCIRGKFTYTWRALLFPADRHKLLERPELPTTQNALQTQILLQLRRAGPAHGVEASDEPAFLRVLRDGIQVCGLRAAGVRDRRARAFGLRAQGDDRSAAGVDSNCRGTADQGNTEIRRPLVASGTAGIGGTGKRGRVTENYRTTR